MAQRAASPYLQTLNLRPARVTEPWLVATLVLLDMVAVWAGPGPGPHHRLSPLRSPRIEALSAPDYYLYYILCGGAHAGLGVGAGHDGASIAWTWPTAVNTAGWLPAPRWAW